MNIKTNLIGSLVRLLVRTEDKTSFTPSKKLFEIVLIYIDNSSPSVYLAECDNEGNRVGGPLVASFLGNLILIPA